MSLPNHNEALCDTLIRNRLIYYDYQTMYMQKKKTSLKKRFYLKASDLVLLKNQTQRGSKWNIYPSLTEVDEWGGTFDRFIEPLHEYKERTKMVVNYSVLYCRQRNRFFRIRERLQICAWSQTSTYQMKPEMEPVTDILVPIRALDRFFFHFVILYRI